MEIVITIIVVVVLAGLLATGASTGVFEAGNIVVPSVLGLTNASLVFDGTFL